MARLPEVGYLEVVFEHFGHWLQQMKNSPNSKCVFFETAFTGMISFFQDNRTQEQFDRREKLSDNQFQYLNMIVILTYISSMMTTKKGQENFPTASYYSLNTSILWENVILWAPPKEKKNTIDHGRSYPVMIPISDQLSCTHLQLSAYSAGSKRFLYHIRKSWLMPFFYWLSCSVAYQIFCSENFHSEITFSLLSFRSI